MILKLQDLLDACKAANHAQEPVMDEIEVQIQGPFVFNTEGEQDCELVVLDATRKCVLIGMRGGK
jgi:hypothetical protein